MQTTKVLILLFLVANSQCGVLPVYKQPEELLGVAAMTINNHMDKINTVNITVGTPVQYITVLLNVASANTWVTDSTCNTTACTTQNPAKTLFNSAASTTFMSMTGFFADPGARGHYAMDTVNLEGLNIPNQQIGDATTLLDSMISMPYAGFLSLGFPVRGQNFVSVIQNLKSQLFKPVFTVSFQKRNGKPSAFNAGQLTFGNLDMAHCSANVDYLPLTGQEWTLSASYFSIGTYQESSSYTAQVLPSQTNIAAPPSIFNAIVRQIGAVQNSQGLVLPCASIGTLSNINISFNKQNVKYSVPPTEYVIDIGLSGGMCLVTIEQSPYDNWVLGDVWIRSHCTVFDFGNMQIGFSDAM